jgi:hypothetical protein
MKAIRKFLNQSLGRPISGRWAVFSAKLRYGLQMDTRASFNIGDSGWLKLTESCSKAVIGFMMESGYFNQFWIVTKISRIA